MDSQSAATLNHITQPRNTLASLAKQQNWDEIKKARAQIAVYSVQKAAERVLLQKQKQKADNLESEQQFNKALGKQIFFEKVATEYGDANSVTKGVFSPKGDLYVTIGSSGQGYVWNTSNPNALDFCQRITHLNAPSKLCGVDFHPRIGAIPGSAPNIVTGSTTGDLQIWTFLPQREQQQSISRQGHTDRINEVKFLQSGSHFITASYDKTWSLWDAKRLGKIVSQKGHEKEIHTASIHPDQGLLLTADLGGSGMVWDLRIGKGIYEIQQTDSILCSDFAPNGYEFAVAGKNNIIAVYDLRRKKELKRIPAHIKLVSDLKYDKNGLFLSSSSHDNHVKLWHGLDYTPLPVENLIEQHKITSIDICDGKLAVTGIDRKWSMHINKLKWSHREEDDRQNDV